MSPTREVLPYDSALRCPVGISSQFAVPGSWFLVLGSQFLVLSSWFLVLGPHFRNQRMARIGCAERQSRFLSGIPGEGFLDIHHGNQFVPRIAQRNAITKMRQRLAGDRERDRQREARPSRQSHVVQDALIVSTPHKTVERRKTACCQQFEIAQSP